MKHNEYHPFTIALFEPQIPPNTGNIARLCSATNCILDVVGEIGFELTDSRLKRAGLDYWKHVTWRRHASIADYLAGKNSERLHFLTTKAERSYAEVEFHPGDTLVFGSETQGVDEAILKSYWERAITIPMVPGIRSLNLGTAVGIVLYEALRQNGFRMK